MTEFPKKHMVTYFYLHINIKKICFYFCIVTYMESSALYYTGHIVSTLIGNDILTKAISDTAGTIYNILYGLVDVSDKKLDLVMEELDIKRIYSYCGISNYIHEWNMYEQNTQYWLRTTS